MMTSSDSFPGLIHFDDALLVAHKPAGLLAVPGRGEDKQDCLSARIQHEFSDALVVHRLDMATSGLMVFARGAEMQRRLSQMFRERRVEKRYVAIVAGRMTAEAGEIDLPLGPDWAYRPRQKVDFAAGKPSLTRYRVLGYENSMWHEKSARAEPVQARSASSHSPFDKLRANGLTDVPAGATRVELEPVTGRTHQLRVHLAAIGHPIAGDALYGDLAPGRLLLHACSLSFVHPHSGEPLTTVCEPPF